MQPDFWLERWRNSEIGFHRDAPNAHLVTHLDWLTRGEKTRVLVPLCGKTLDMRYLAENGHSVVGVELADAAAQAFFAENDLPVSRTQDGPRWRYESGSVEIVVGDFFEVSAQDVGTFDAVFDRAALVALPPAMRERYVKHLSTLMSDNARMLLVTFVYDGAFEGPPFSVPATEVQSAFSFCKRVEQSADVDVLASSARFADRGATHVREQVWLIDRLG